MNIVCTVLLICGLIFFTGGAVGIIRFPDFYSRLHPAGKLDTMGSLLMLLGISLFNIRELTLINILTSLKIMLILVFVFLSSPTAIHSIVDAGVRAGLIPWKKGEPRR